jgi:hypothetical protein
MKHAKLSPSAAEKWTNCPGMPTLAAKVDYQVGLPAAVGTLIHNMTEQLLKGFLVDVTLEDYWLGKKEYVEDFEIEVDQDMIDCANVYVNYIQERARVLGGKLLIEERVFMDEISPDIWGTADAIIIGEKALEIVDLKSGKWAVDAHDNGQLKIYALGALSRYSSRYKDEDIEVIMTIVQPRGWHKDGIIRSSSTTATNLVNWGFEVLKPAAEACFEENPQFNPSKETCKFCNAKDHCDAYKNTLGEKND